MSKLQELLEKVFTNRNNQENKGYGLAYLRVSNEESDEKAQRADIEAFAQRYNILIPPDGWFADHGVRANDDLNRENFWQMIERAKNDPKVRWIIIREDSRFYRNKTKARKLKDELRKYGVTVLSATTYYDPDSVTGTLLESISETLPEVNSRQVRDWTIARMRHHCQQRDPSTGWCYKNGGPAPFGYRIHRVQRGFDKRGLPKFSQVWLLDETDNAGRPCWEWVRVILVDWFLKEGIGYCQITERLNKIGVKPQRKTFWNGRCVQQLLIFSSLLTYAGCYIWGKYKAKWLGERVNEGKRPMDEWLIVENAHPAILTYEEVEDILQEREKRKEFCDWGGLKGRTYRSPYLLTGGLAKCKVCGSNVVGLTSSTRNRRVRRYTCGGYLYSNGVVCQPSFSVPKDLIENAIYNEIKSQFALTPEIAQTWADKVNAYLLQEYQREQNQFANLENELRTIEHELENIVAAIKAGVLTTTLIEEARKLERRKQEIERKLKEKNHTNVPTVTAQDILNWWQDLDRTMNFGSNEDKRKVLRMFIKEISWDPKTRQVEVVFYRWNATLNFYFSGGPGGI